MSDVIFTYPTYTLKLDEIRVYVYFVVGSRFNVIAYKIEFILAIVFETVYFIHFINSAIGWVPLDIA